MPKTDLERMRPSSVCAVVIDESGRILLHQKSDNGRWAIPGGVIEIDERADVAIVREVREETGYIVEPIRLVGIYSDPQSTTVSYPDGNVWTYVALLFECKKVGGRPELSDESLGVEWFSLENLPDSLKDSHHLRIRDTLQKQEAAYYR